MSDCWVVSFGDTHCGLKFGLLMPETELHEEGPNGELIPYHPELTATQRFLLELYQDQIQAVSDITAGAPVVLLHGGDICHGDKHPSQLMSTRLSDQVFIAADVLRRWQAVPGLRAVRLLLGTEAHNSGEGSLEYLVTRQIEGDLPDVRISSHWMLEIDDVLFDVAHHGPGPSSRYWLNANMLRFYMQDMVLRDIVELGERPPDVVLRYHRHSYVPAVLHYVHRKTTQSIRGYVHPAYCGMNYYAQMVTRSRATTHVGLLMFHIVDGDIVEVVDRMVVWMDRRTREVIDV